MNAQMNAQMNVQQKKFTHRVGASFIIIAVLMATFSLFVTLPAHGQTASDETAAAEASGTSGGSTQAISEQDAERQKWGLLSAALAFGFGALGAGMAISKVGSAAMGAMSERPEIGSQALIFVAMAEGIVIFGFISALMILGKF